MNKPRIMLVGHSAGSILGGAERSLVDIVSAVDRQKFELLCALPDSDPNYLSEISRYIDDITFFPLKWWNGTRAGDQESVAYFEALFTKKNIGLVHVNTITMMDAIIAARRLEIRSLIHAREIITSDGELAKYLGGEPETLLERIIDISDHIVCNSDYTHHLYYKQGKSFRLYNCVDIDRFDMENIVKNGRLKVGIISTNIPKKGLGNFIQLAALAEERNCSIDFYVIGPDNEHTRELQQQMREAGRYHNVIFKGYIHDPADAIGMVNVVVSFSLVPESFGRTIAEAMAARRPVIAFDAGAMPELIRHGQDGFLVQFPFVELALPYVEQVATDRHLMEQMSKVARVRAEQLFSPALFAATLNDIYRTIMTSPAQ